MNNPIDKDDGLLLVRLRWGTPRQEGDLPEVPRRYRHCSTLETRLTLPRELKKSRGNIQ